MSSLMVFPDPFGTELDAAGDRESFDGAVLPNPVLWFSRISISSSESSDVPIPEDVAKSSFLLAAREVEQGADDEL